VTPGHTDVTGDVLPVLLSVNVVVLNVCVVVVEVVVVVGGWGKRGGVRQQLEEHHTLTFVRDFVLFRNQLHKYTIKPVNQGLVRSCCWLHPPLQQAVHTTAGQSKRYYYVRQRRRIEKMQLQLILCIKHVQVAAVTPTYESQEAAPSPQDLLVWSGCSVLA